MSTIIILMIIVLIVVYALRQSMGHFKGEGGCCGGESKQRQKHIKNQKYKKEYSVTGMHCHHCEIRVENRINEEKGMTCKASYKKGIVTVKSQNPLDDQHIENCLKDIGYHLNHSL